LLGIYYISDN